MMSIDETALSKANEAAELELSDVLKDWHYVMPTNGIDRVIRSYLSALTPQDVGALVDRLRNERPTNMMTVLALHLEAATLIQSQAAELAELKRKLAVADKALEPLGRLADAVFYVDDVGREANAGKPDDSAVWGFDNATLTYGHLRAARRARETIGASNEQD